MAVLPIRLFPDPILRERSRPTHWQDPPLKKFLTDLVETLYAQPGGVGIAAPQVGEARRVIALDVSPKDPSKRLILMINPLIRRIDGKIMTREGCMSLPDYTANVERGLRVLAHWTDPQGRRREKLFTGVEAICLQHEIDHLNGLLFTDRVTSLKTDVFVRARYFT